MATSKAKTATAASGISAVDQEVKELFSRVQDKKLALAQAEKPNWNTEGSFRYSLNSIHDSINIRTVTDQRKLVDILAFLRERDRNHSAAASELGVNMKPFTWLGFSVDEWSADLRTRVDQINLADKRKEFAMLEARLNNVISPELKRQMELEEITKLLGA